jgi:hypothetical protein
VSLAHYFVWYRVEDDGPDTETLVRSMMARLACRTGISGNLLKKRDEPALWMEVYSGVPEATAFEARLAQAVDEFDIDMLIADRRHTECFYGDVAPQPSCGTGI